MRISVFINLISKFKMVIDVDVGTDFTNILRLVGKRIQTNNVSNNEQEGQQANKSTTLKKWPNQSISRRKKIRVDHPNISLFEVSPAYADDFPGEFHFSFLINRSKAQNLEFSKRVAKVYVKMGQALPLCFHWSSWHRPADFTSGREFFLRASMVFAAAEFRSRPVQRCYAHAAVDAPDNVGVSPEVLFFVFRVQSESRAIYCANPETGELSTVISLGRLDGNSATSEASVDFRFYCNNSCPTGINRRATKMLFTLEDAEGRVLGRRSLQIQISSVPKRNKNKDEQELLKSEFKPPQKQKKTSSTFPPVIPPKGKKLTPNAADNQLCPIKLNILGEENYRAVLKYAHDLMSAQAYRTGNEEVYKPLLEELQQKMQE